MIEPEKLIAALKEDLPNTYDEDVAGLVPQIYLYYHEDPIEGSMPPDEFLPALNEFGHINVEIIDDNTGRSNTIQYPTRPVDLDMPGHHLIAAAAEHFLTDPLVPTILMPRFILPQILTQMSPLIAIFCAVIDNTVTFTVEETSAIAQGIPAHAVPGFHEFVYQEFFLPNSGMPALNIVLKLPRDNRGRILYDETQGVDSMFKEINLFQYCT